MINLLLMNGYGLFVWSAFAFTLINFLTLYVIINRQPMYSKKVKLRFVFIVVFLILIALTTFTVLKVLKDNVVYFKSPSEINLLSEISNKKIRVGGMVKKDSVMMRNNKINFIITDFKNELYVTFSGTVPNLFEEEKGVVAEGFLNDKKFLVADKILAKHDENYMPPEVKKSLGE